MGISFIIREAEEEDVEEITLLFRATVETVNAKDYNKDQLQVWSAGADRKDRWLIKIKNQYFLVACNNKEIVGFASVTMDGYVDFMYVHKDFQGQGIAGKLLFQLEEYAKQVNTQVIYSDVSITAKPFFERHGYVVKKKQEKIVEGVLLVNYRMEKRLVAIPS